jgi:GNAT superfamily N-acetyltransferase
MIEKRDCAANGIRFSVRDGEQEVGHAYLYILRNDLHDKPFGFMEDVFIEETSRKSGYGTDLLTTLMDEARAQGCYKLVGASRNE